MAWTVVTKEETAKYCRTTEDFLQDEWYEMVFGAIERYTGWYSLDSAENFTGYVDGNGSSILKTEHTPINTVTTLQIDGLTIPSGYYYVAWNGIQLRTYRPGESYTTTVWLERTPSFGNIFPLGIKNIYVAYNVGGTASLPSKYLESLRLTALMCIKEFTVIPRGEGSDYKMNRFRPDRTLNPEEVLTSYGVHGKIDGIMRRFLPKRKVFI